MIKEIRFTAAGVVGTYNDGVCGGAKIVKSRTGSEKTNKRQWYQNWCIEWYIKCID